MYRDLFVDYLRMVLPKDGNGNASPKTIKEYLSGLSRRICYYANKYHSGFVDITQMNFDDATKLITHLLNDKEFREHCQGSNGLHITAINQYSRFINYVKSNKSGINVDKNGKTKNIAKEGMEYECHNIEYKRNRELRDEVARERHYICEICGVQLNEIYGPIADEFIEVHHKKPVHDGERTTTKDDLTCVCPNCHTMLHRENPILSPEELKLRLKIARI
jgi:predicted HNH restriction endonuclease